MFSKKKKKLNLREIHKLYLLLKPHLPEQEEKFLIDEIEKMLDNLTPHVFYRTLEIIYKDRDLNKHSPIGLLSLFMDGLRENSFFEYVNFVKGLNGKRRTTP